MLLSSFLLLSDVRSAEPSVIYDHARKAFVAGYLEDSQRESDEGYRRFLYSNPDWARKFLLLEANSMSWRGLYDDVLRLPDDSRASWDIPDELIQRLALQVRALTELHRFTEADRLLAAGELICARANATHCRDLLRARGMLLVEHGDLAQGKRDIQSSLRLAQGDGDAMMQGEALLDLGYIALQQERHDDASELFQLASDAATRLGAKDLEQRALGNEAWEKYSQGNPEKALSLFGEAEKQAVSLGNKGGEIEWLSASATVYANMGQLDLAEKIDLQAISLAEKINDKQNIINASMDLAQDYVVSGKPDDSDRYSNLALNLERETGSPLDLLNIHLIQGQAAALRHDWPRADTLLHEVLAAADSQSSMKWDAQRALGNLYEAQGDQRRAEQAYEGALALIEGTRAALKQEESRLTFLSKAARIYDDYIHFLVANGKGEEALEAADWSRARTLQQGLELIASGASYGTVPAALAAPSAPPRIRAVEIARKANATLLFYWLGERQSYLWAVSSSGMTLIPLPAKSDIVPRMERYRRALLDLKDPLKDGNRDGRALYETLVAPAAKIVPPGGRVVLLTDGELSALNFETLVVAAPTPHYWIEDATVLSAPSIRMFAATKPATTKPTSTKPAEKTGDRLLLMGDAISPGPEFPPLPMASVEVRKIQPQFADAIVFTRERATPSAYLKSRPEQFTYIHFVTHGTASRLDPLDSAVVLSRSDSAGRGVSDPGGTGDAYKLYARDILAHPINARLVTISACDSSGSKAVAGEGLVGVSWAFLRAGAHNAIGALWEVSDASTPELMDRMYGGLQKGEAPADALREAKLALMHSGGKFAKPFYWAPFQLYAGR